ncbi:MAG: hypothetical protein J6J60_05490 [Clostridia bacterium]|nr:hypothetical protein [Clostridia bacterium]
MSLFFHRNTKGIVNVKMVITEEKILSNIDKIQKLINPKSKKQIVQLEEDSYFKDLVESVKSYLLEYPKKNSFPTSVYTAAYGLVEFATNQFEENTKTIEDLIRKREKNIKLGSVLRDATKVVKARAKNWKEIVKKLEPKYSPDVAEALKVIGDTKNTESEEYKNAIKLIEVKVNNLESNLHLEIDMERIEDTSKALSYIGIEIAEALKYIPTPMDGNSEPEQSTVTKSKNKKSKLLQVEQENDETDTTSDIGKIVSKKNKPNIDIDAEIEEESEEAEEYDIEVDYEDEDEEVEEETQEESVTEENEGSDVEQNVACAETEQYEDEDYITETRFEKKPSLWQRIKNSKIVRTINFILKIRVVLDYPALPEPESNK